MSPITLADASTVSLFIAVSLASLVFLCTVLIVAALMLRDRWDEIGRRGRTRPRR